MALKILGFGLAFVVALGVLTYVAGEVKEVVVLRTYDKTGAAHDTKLWVVDYEGTPWVRVGKPQRLWYRRLLRQSSVELIRGPQTSWLTAHAHPDLETRQALDRQFREKYGLVDWWFGVLVRRGAVPIQLEPMRNAGPVLPPTGPASSDSHGSHAQ